MENVWTFLGGGTIVALAALVLHARAENARTRGQAGKLNAEAEVVLASSVQDRYDRLFDDLEATIRRLEEERADLSARLDAALSQLAHLRVEAANATADVTKAAEQVRRARAEIIRLEDRVSELEAAAAGMPLP